MFVSFEVHFLIFSFFAVCSLLSCVSRKKLSFVEDYKNSDLRSRHVVAWALGACRKLSQRFKCFFPIHLVYVSSRTTETQKGRRFFLGRKRSFLINPKSICTRQKKFSQRHNKLCQTNLKKFHSMKEFLFILKNFREDLSWNHQPSQHHHSHNLHHLHLHLALRLSSSCQKRSRKKI